MHQSSDNSEYIPLAVPNLRSRVLTSWYERTLGSFFWFLLLTQEVPGALVLEGGFVGGSLLLPLCTRVGEVLGLVMPTSVLTGGLVPLHPWGFLT